MKRLCIHLAAKLPQGNNQTITGQEERKKGLTDPRGSLSALGYIIANDKVLYVLLKQ